MNARKLFAAGLSLALALSLSVPALASSAPADTVVETPNPTTGLYSAQTDVTGDITVPTIKVTVPTAGAVMVNPYQMKYTLNSKDYTDQIVSVPQLIKNESNVAVSVNATVTGLIPENSGAVFATAALKGTETTKSLFIYLETITGTEALTVAADGSITKSTWATGFDAKAANMVAVSNKAVVKAGLVTIDAATPGASDADPVTPAYAAFHLAGGAATKPAKAWTDADTVNVGIAFSFVPVMNPAPAPAP